MLLASAAMFLTSSAMSQTLDLANMAVIRGNLELTPGTPYTLVTNGQLTLSLPETRTFAGTLQNGSNPLALTIVNNGTLVLTGTANSYSGMTSISTGATLAAGATNAFSANSAISNGNLDLRGSDQVIGGVIGTTMVRTTGAAPVTLSINTANGAIRSSNGSFNQTAGAITIVKTGSGRQNFNAASNFTGGITIAAGTVGVGTGTSLGTGAITFTGASTLATDAANITLRNAIVLAAHGTFNGGTQTSTLAGEITGPGRLTLAGAGQINVTGVNSYAGGTTLASRAWLGSNSALGTGAINAAVGSGLGTTGGSITLDNAIALSTLLQITAPAPGAVLALNGPISGTSGLWLRFGDGTLRLGGANSYAGTTQVSRGTLAVGNNLAFGSSFVAIVGAATLQADAAGLNIANGISLSGGNLLTVDTKANDLTLSGIVRNRSSLAVGSLTKTGSGVLTLTRANSYSLGTIISAGTIAIASDLNLGAAGGPLTLNGGDLRVTGAGFTTARAITLTGAGGAFDIADAAGNIVATRAITGAGTLVKNGLGTLTLAAANGYGGGTLLSAGTLAIGNGEALGTGTLTIAGGTLTASAAGVSLGNAVVLADAVNTIDAAATPLTLAGVIGGSGGLRKTGAGTLTLTNAANSYAGGTTVTGGAVEVTNGTVLGTGAVALGDGTSIIASAPMTIANAFVLTGATTFAQGANALTLGGAIGGTGSLTKTGAGTLTLTAANSFSGGSSIAAGTVVAGDSAALGTGTATLAAGTALRAATTLVLANAIAVDGSTIDTNGFDIAAGGVVSGTALTKAGAGTLTLAGDNSYFGGTTLAAGTLAVGSNTAAGTGTIDLAADTTLRAAAPGVVLANAMTVAGSAVDTNGFDLTLNGVIAGTALTKTGAGTLTACAANTYSGGTTVAAGTFAVCNAASLGTEAATFAAGTTLQAAAGVTLANDLVVAGSTVDTNGFDLTLAGAVGGTALAKAGAGTLSLTGINGFTGGTTVAGGTLAVGNGGALGAGAVAVAAGTSLQASADLALANAVTLGGAATIDTQAFVLTLDGVVAGPGALTKAGTGTLRLNGANTYSGGTAIAGGGIEIGNNAALGTGTVALSSGRALQAGATDVALANAITLGGPGTIDSRGFALTVNGVISGTGPLTKAGSGSLHSTGSTASAAAPA